MYLYKKWPNCTALVPGGSSDVFLPMLARRALLLVLCKQAASPIDVLPVGKGPTCDVPQVPTISLLCQVSDFISTYAVHPRVNSPSLLPTSSSCFSDFPLRIKTATLPRPSDSIFSLLRTIALRTGVFRASAVIFLPNLH